MKLYRIKKSNIDKNGKGLYATKDIKEGTRIINYIGNIITRRESDTNPKFDNTKPIYLFNLNNRYDLDGDVTWNTARLINHSCSNNCDYEGTGLKIWVTAIKDIKKGEELTLKYTMYRVDNADQMCYNKSMKQVKKIVLGIIAVGGFISLLAITLNLLQGTL